MAKLFPELVFTRGPQKGQRIVLSKTMNVVGRDKGCEVEIEDEYASRQHARIIVEGSRIRLVNTSPNGTKVNGKQIEQAVLNPGDVILFGLECEARLETEAATSSAGKQPAAAKPGSPPPLPRSGDKPAQAVAEDAAQDGKKKPKKPPAIMLVGIYLLVIAALFVTLPWLLGKQASDSGTGLELLTNEQLADMLDRPLSEDINPRLEAMEKEEAIKAYYKWKTGTTGPGHLYRTLGHFKRSLAHAGPDVRTFGVQTHRPLGGQPKLVQDMMDEVRNALLERVGTTYRNAYVAQRDSKWEEAQRLYHEVLNMIDDAQDPIRLHALRQLNFVKTQMLRQPTGRRRW